MPKSRTRSRLGYEKSFGTELSFSPPCLHLPCISRARPLICVTGTAAGAALPSAILGSNRSDSRSVSADSDFQHKQATLGVNVGWRTNHALDETLAGWRIRFADEGLEMATGLRACWCISAV